MRAVLHIGMPKTGTSSIQDFCGENQDALLQEGVLFARTGRIIGGRDKRRHMGFSFACHPIEAAPTNIMRNYGLKRALVRRSYAKRFWRRLDSELARQNDVQTVVLSEEGLFETHYPSLVAEAHEKLGARFAQVHVMCMLREPFALLSSSYVQAVKIGTGETWEVYRDRMLDAGVFTPMIQRWLDVFGPDQMKVRVLQHDALEPFADVVGFKLPYTSARTSNVSMSAIGVEQLRALNAAYQKAGQKRPKAVRKAFGRHMKGPSWRAPASDAALIYDRLKPEIAQLGASGLLTSADQEYVAARWTPEKAVEKRSPNADIYADGAEGMTALLKSLFR